MEHSCRVAGRVIAENGDLCWFIVVGNGVKSTHILYLRKSNNTAMWEYSIRLRSHQNLLAADFVDSANAFHCMSAVNSLRNLPFASESPEFKVYFE